MSCKRINRTLILGLASIPAAWAQSPASLAIVNAANYVSQIAPGGMATAFGTNLADAQTSVNVCTPQGCVAATVLAASPTQLSFVAPDPLPGPSVTVQVMHGAERAASGTSPVSGLSPGIFTVDNSGTGIFNGRSYDQGAFNLIYDPAQAGVVPRPVAATIDGAPNTLILYGTGWKNANPANVRVTVGGVTVKPGYAGPSGATGVDLLTVDIPAGLATQAAQLVNVSVAFQGTDNTTGVYNTRTVQFCLAGSGGGAQTCPAPTAATPSCTEPLPGLAAPYAPHGIFLLQFQGANPVPINNYLRNQPTVCGGDLYVVWSTVDKGNGTYDWSSVDNVIAPWVQAGKIVNLIVWGVSDARPNNGTPAYVMNDAAYQSVTCQENGQTLTYPVYYTGSYKTNYKTFIQAVMNRYGANPNVGYIRFGLARGGEDFPTCLPQMMTLSKTPAIARFDTVWENYIGEMTALQKTLQSAIVSNSGRSVQLMAAVNQYGFPIQFSTIAYEAQNAKSLGFGFGSQGLQLSDVTAYKAGRPCGSDWCNAFQSNVGGVPLELQTIAASDPANAPGGTGSLTVLLPFALDLKAQILEVYIQDLQVAYDPTSPNYNKYNQTYQQMFSQVAGSVGFAPIKTGR